MAEDRKCSIAGTACVPCAVPLPCAPGDLELPLSASLLFGIFWKAILLMCKAEWMCQGISSPTGATLTQCLMGVGVCITQIPNTETRVYTFPRSFPVGLNFSRLLWKLAP